VSSDSQAASSTATRMYKLEKRKRKIALCGTAAPVCWGDVAYCCLQATVTAAMLRWQKAAAEAAREAAQHAAQQALRQLDQARVRPLYCADCCLLVYEGTSRYHVMSSRHTCPPATVQTLPLRPTSAGPVPVSHVLLNPQALAQAADTKAAEKDADGPARAALSLEALSSWLLRRQRRLCAQRAWLLWRGRAASGPGDPLHACP